MAPRDVAIAVASHDAHQLPDMIHATDDQLVPNTITQLDLSGPAPLNRQNAECLVTFLEQVRSIRTLHISCRLDQDGAADILSAFLQDASRSHSIVSIHWNLLCSIDMGVLQCLASGFSNGQNSTVTELQFSFFAFNTDPQCQELLKTMLLGKRKSLKTLNFCMCSFGSNVSGVADGLAAQEQLQNISFIGGKPNDASSASIIQQLPKSNLQYLCIDNPQMSLQSFHAIVRLLCSKECKVRDLILPQHFFAKSSSGRRDPGAKEMLLAALQLSNASLERLVLTFTIAVSSLPLSHEERDAVEVELNQYSRRNRYMGRVRDLFQPQNAQPTRPFQTRLASPLLAQLGKLKPRDGASATFLVLTELDLQQ